MLGEQWVSLPHSLWMVSSICLHVTMRYLSYREMKYFQGTSYILVVIKSSCDPGCWLWATLILHNVAPLNITPCDSHIPASLVSDICKTVSCGMRRAGPWGWSGYFRPSNLLVTPTGTIEDLATEGGVEGSDSLVTSSRTETVLLESTLSYSSLWIWFRKEFVSQIIYRLFI